MTKSALLSKRKKRQNRLQSARVPMRTHAVKYDSYGPKCHIVMKPLHHNRTHMVIIPRYESMRMQCGYAKYDQIRPIKHKSRR